MLPHILAAPGDAVTSPVLDAPGAPGSIPGFTPPEVYAPGFPSSNLRTIGGSVPPSSSPSLPDIVLSNSKSFYPTSVP